MESFFASIKISSGEELLCIVTETNLENDYIKIRFPIEVEEIEIPGIVHGLKIKYWLKTSKTDDFIINGENIISLTEIHEESIEFYKKSLYKLETGDDKDTKDTEVKRKNKNYPDGRVSIDRDMGLLSSIEDARTLLEQLFLEDSSDRKDSKDSK